MVRAPRSTDLEARVVDRLPRFKLRGSRLVDVEPGLLGLVAGSGSICAEGLVAECSKAYLMLSAQNSVFQR